MKNKQKRDIVCFFVGGLFALILSKSEAFINKKAGEYFPDEDTPQEN